MARGRLALLFAVVALLVPAAAQASHPEVRGAVTHPLWGDVTAADTTRELDLLDDAHANTVRIDIGWSTLEAAGDGVYSQWYVDKADAFFAQARARGLRVVVTFWSTPCWASSAPDDKKQGCAGAWWDRGVDRYPPADPAEFAEAAAWVVDRWGNDIDAIEVWNEPNYSGFFNAPDRDRDYAALLKATYPVLKAEDAGVKVIGGALLMSDAPFLRDLYGHGIKRHFDAISIRPYSHNRPPGDTSDPYGRGALYSYANGVPSVRDVMADNGDADKKLWLTELGWSSCAPAGTNFWCVTREQQAEYIADALAMIRERWPYVEAAFVYNLRNKGTNAGDRESQMGMLDRDFAPKPSYWAFKDALDALGQWHSADPPPVPPAPPPPPPAGDQNGSAQAQPEPAPPAGGQPQPLPPPSVVRDVVAPSLRALAVVPRRLTVRTSSRAAVSFKVSERANVTVGLRRSRGRRWVAVGRPLRRSVAVGSAKIALRRKLAAGVYELRATAVDAAGNPASGRVRFRVRG